MSIRLTTEYIPASSVESEHGAERLVFELGILYRVFGGPIQSCVVRREWACDPELAGYDPYRKLLDDMAAELATTIGKDDKFAVWLTGLLFDRSKTWFGMTTIRETFDAIADVQAERVDRYGDSLPSIACYVGDPSERHEQIWQQWEAMTA